jgi:predicted peptidase
MIEALKAAGATPRYTEYAGVGHNSWSRAYATDEMWEWMFGQRRQAK